MNKRTAKMIAYEMASTIIYDAAYGSELARQDERVKSAKDVEKIQAALDEISKALWARRDEMAAKSNPSPLEDAALREIAQKLQEGLIWVTSKHPHELEDFIRKGLVETTQPPFFSTMYRLTPTGVEYAQSHGLFTPPA